jgi:hypothetical protein
LQPVLTRHSRRRHRTNTWAGFLCPLLTIAVPLLAIRLWIPPRWSAHDVPH